MFFCHKTDKTYKTQFKKRAMAPNRDAIATSPNGNQNKRTLTKTRKKMEFWSRFLKKPISYLLLPTSYFTIMANQNPRLVFPMQVHCSA